MPEIRYKARRGILDYGRILSEIYRVDPDVTLVLEGTVGEDIAYAVSHLRKIINEIERNK